MTRDEKERAEVAGRAIAALLFLILAMVVGLFWGMFA